MCNATGHLRAVVLITGLPAVGAARAEAAATAEETKRAIARFEKELAAKDAAARAGALRSLGKVDHEDVSARLLEELPRQRVPEPRAAVFDALAGQASSAAKAGKAVEKAVIEEAAKVAEAFRRGDAGFLVNPRTGEPDVTSAEGKAALAAAATRDRMVAAGFRCLLALGHHDRLDGSAIGGVLQSPDDDLVEVALAAAGKWGLRDALPAILMLFRMYPRENRWETGAVTHAGGTNATAKAEWMLYFGHPGRKIPRPRVFAAVKAAVLALTGREVDDPEDLAALLKEPAGRQRSARRGR